MKTAGAALKNPPVSTETFEAHGRTYRWTEGSSAVGRTLRHPFPREEGAAFFARRVAAVLERRDATKVSYPAALGESDVRWVSWSAPGDPAPVWALYVSARKVDPQATAHANDTLALLAWGDGMVLAWVDARPVSLAFVRAALRTPPAWLVGGMRSGDAAFPVRIDCVRGHERATPPAMPGTVVLPSKRAGEGAGLDADAENPVLGIVRAWRRAHGGREPFVP